MFLHGQNNATVLYRFLCLWHSDAISDIYRVPLWAETPCAQWCTPTGLGNRALNIVSEWPRRWSSVREVLLPKATELRDSDSNTRTPQPKEPFQPRHAAASVIGLWLGLGWGAGWGWLWALGSRAKGWKSKGRWKRFYSQVLPPLKTLNRKVCLHKPEEVFMFQLLLNCFMH